MIHRCFFLKIVESKYFRREKFDVHTDATISLSQAVLGGDIKVQGLYEDITVKVIFNTIFF